MSVTPWQLQMFQRSLKKRLKLESLLAMLGDILPQTNCLLISCGDNNGALNYYFREHGGQWQWADVETEDVAEMSAFLGDAVHSAPPNSLPFSDESFDLAVAIDVLEHLDDERPFLAELKRTTKAAGKILVTVPNGDDKLLANRLKWRLGMTPEVYGHTRAGYTSPQLAAALSASGLTPTTQGGYSRFFTEMVELAINFGYVFMLNRKGKGDAGKIAPTTANELKTHGLAYRLYSALFPIFRLISKLDNLLPASNNHAVTILATKG